MKEWPKLRITEGHAHEYFNGQPQNIGVLLGEPSGNLIDVDLDCAEAVKLAPHFLPRPHVTFGRTSKPDSHYLYLSEVTQSKFKAPDGKMLLELRSTGGQTVFPGSTHPSGEAIEWTNEGSPAHVTRDQIGDAVGKVAACSLLAQLWNAGSRHDLALAVAGGLARAAWTRDDAIKFILCAAEIAGDDELEDREKGASDTFERLDTGNIKGWPSVAAIIGDEPVRRIRDFLSITAKDAFPPLEAITETPTLRREGSILNESGYDPSTRLIYHPAKGFTMPAISDRPTRADVAHALVTLIDVLDDFPFLNQASRANTLALMLTPIIRPHIDLAPLALLDAPQAGTGKGLLTDRSVDCRNRQTRSKRYRAKR